MYQLSTIFRQRMQRLCPVCGSWPYFFQEPLKDGEGVDHSAFSRLNANDPSFIPCDNIVYDDSSLRRMSDKKQAAFKDISLLGRIRLRQSGMQGLIRAIIARRDSANPEFHTAQLNERNLGCDTSGAANRLVISANKSCYAIRDFSEPSTHGIMYDYLLPTSTDGIPRPKVMWNTLLDGISRELTL